jgi:hypothetical protein
MDLGLMLLAGTDAFYPNTGDINSAFVQPRATDVEPATRTAPSSSPDSSSKATASAPTQTGAIELVKSSEDPDEVQELQQEAASREVESQVTEAPLAKRQEELDKEDESVLRDVPDRAGQGEGEKEHKRAALVDDDRELYRVDKVRPFTKGWAALMTDDIVVFEQVLREIHARFYQTYDSADKKIAFQPASEPDNRILYDVRVSLTLPLGGRSGKLIRTTLAYNTSYETESSWWMRDLFLGSHSPQSSTRRVSLRLDKNSRYCC